MRDTLNKNENLPAGELFKRGFISGIGWAIGVTIGFVIVSTVIVFVLRQLGGLPLVGGLIANIVEATVQQLSRRNPVFQVY